jgi:hypothetical protein
MSIDKFNEDLENSISVSKIAFEDFEYDMDNINMPRFNHALEAQRQF